MEHIYGVPALADSDQIGTIGQWSRALARTLAARDAAIVRDTGTIPEGDPETVAGMVARLGALEAAVHAPWMDLPLAGAWRPYTAGGGYYPGLRVRMTPLGLQLQGMIAGGSAVSDIADLPDSVQPPYAVMFPASAAGNVTAYCSISNSGGRMKLRYNAGPSAPGFVAIQAVVPLA